MNTKKLSVFFCALSLAFLSGTVKPAFADTTLWNDNGVDIFSDVNVGLGTSAPTAKLDVIGSGKFSGDLDVSGILKLAQGATDGYYLKSDANGNASWSAIPASAPYSAGNAMTLSGSSFDFGGALSADSRVYRTGGTGPSYEMMFMKNSNGNVGFGTINPTAKLEISASGYGGSGPSTPNALRLNQAGKYLTVGGNGYQYMFSTDATGGYSFDSTVIAGGGNVTLAKYSTVSSINSGLNVYSGLTVGSGNLTLSSGNLLSSSGKIGLGTTNPTQKIDVVGGGIRVNGNGVSKPTCTASARGTMWFTAGVGVSKDTLELCAQGTGSTAVAWRTLY